MQKEYLTTSTVLPSPLVLPALQQEHKEAREVLAEALGLPEGMSVLKKQVHSVAVGGLLYPAKTTTIAYLIRAKLEIPAVIVRAHRQSHVLDASQ